MPRKNPRPQAKKWAARKKVRMAKKAASKRRVGMIAHHHPKDLSLAALALMVSRISRST